MRKPEYIEFTRAEVARRARQLWIAAGRPGSRYCQFWLEAELEIIAAALATLRELKAAARPPRLALAHAQRRPQTTSQSNRTQDTGDYGRTYE